jgi:hypothetical protein
MELSKVIPAIEIGHQKEFISFGQLNELCSSKFEPEDIEILLSALNAEGIQVTDEQVTDEQDRLS